MIGVTVGAIVILLFIALIALRFERPDGAIERGVTVWSEPLAPDLADYFTHLPDGYRVRGKIRDRAELFSSFIRKEANIAQVVVVHTGRGLWPWKYIGVVYLRMNPVTIDYRVQKVALFGAITVLGLSFIKFFVSGFGKQSLLVPIVLILMTTASHFAERNRILSYLQECLRLENEAGENNEQVSEESVKKSYIARVRGYNE